MPVISTHRVLAAVAAVAGGHAAHAGFFTDITVVLRVDCLEDLSTTSKKGGSIGILGSPGDGQLPPEALKILRGIIQVRVVDGPAAGFSVTKRTLTNAEAYGAGLPNGYTGLPYADPGVTCFPLPRSERNANPNIPQS